MNFKLHSNRIEPIANADNFFSKPELLNQSIIASHVPTKCSAGCLALRIPDPPMYSLPAICAISKNGNIAAVGGRDVELYLWDTNTGALLHTIRGHDVCWTSSYANDFYVTVQEDSKVITWDQDLHTQRSVLGQPQEPLACCAVSLDDAYVVVGGYQGSVYAYSSNGNEVHHFAGGHVGAVQTVMCYAMEDGSHNIISCGTMDQTIVIWDLTSGERRLSVPVDELEHAKTLRYHIKDGTHVLVWCTDAVPFPNLVLVDTINQTKSSVYSHEGLVRHAVFNKAGDSIISCGSDGKIIVWESATLEARVTLNGHTGAVLCCSINNEGTRICSSGEDATIRVWSAEDGRQLQRMEAQDEPVKMCTYAKKGSKILTCDATGRAYVWSSMSEVVLNLVRRYADSISAISMSNDSKLLLSGSNNGRVMLWDVHKRRNLWEFSHHTGRVESVSFNSVRDQAASAGADGRVSLINTETGKQINSFMGNNEPILNISFSPDDERLGGLSADGKLLIYMVGTSNRKPKLVLHSNIARIAAFVWSPNSKLLAGCGSDGCVLVWNAVSGSIFTVLEGTSAATCCAFDQIGKLVAVGTHMGATVLYNLETAELLSELRYNAGPVREVTFNQETSKLATICGRQAHIWDVATSKKIRTFDFIVDAEGDFRENPLNPYRTAVAHSGTILFDPESEAIVYDMVPIDDPLLRSYYLSDSRMVSSGTQNHKRFTVWSATGSTTPDKFHTTHDAITSCHFSNDDRLIVMGTQDGNIVVYDVQHNETVEVIAAHQNGPCRCVRLSSDNSEVLSCGADAKVILWDWRNRMATRIYSGHFISVGCCDLAFQGNRVVSGDNHGMITIFDKVTGDSVQAIPLAHSKSVLSVSMSADGSTIASVGADDKVSIWSVEDGVELVSLTAAIESHPLYCTFSHDGNKLAVTESSGSIMIWNAIAGCQWYIIKEAHKGRVTSCTWSFDCRRFVTAGQDSILAVWDSESGAPLLKYDIATGPLTTCAVSPMGVYVAAGSSTGTLSVCSIPLSSKVIPEPSFLYHWMSNREPKVAQDLFAKLSKRFSTIPNVQDAQGWSLIHHTVSRGNAQVAQLILATVPKGSGCLGLTSAVPYTIQTHVKFHEDDMNGPLGESTEKDKKDSSALAHGDQRQIRRPPAIDLYSFAGPSLGTIQVVGSPIVESRNGKGSGVHAVQGGGFFGSMMGMGKGNSQKKSSGRNSGRMSQGSFSGSANDFYDGGGGDFGAGVQKSTKSFSQRIKKVAVELFTEKAVVEAEDIIINNSLALSLNSQSSECVRVILDAAAENKISWGSYHCITDMMPSLSVRYPFMCFQFLACLELLQLGELEVPVNVMKGLEGGIIRTAPIFTNVQHLWQSHFKGHEVKSGPQPYAHVKASMVRLPFACAVGKQSLLQTLVQSDVPVQAYGTPTVRAVIRHKWRLYASQRLSLRTALYVLYTFMFTVWAVMYEDEISDKDSPLPLSDFWSSSGTAKAQLIIGVYLFIQSLWYGWFEIAQMLGIGTRYLRSLWNLIDICGISLMLVIHLMHVARSAMEFNGALGPLIAIEVILVYSKLAFYALVFEQTGPLVNMVLQITWQVRTWVCLLLVTMSAFGTALMVLYDSILSTSDDQYQDYGHMLLTMWRMVLYQFDISDLIDHQGSWAVFSLIIFCMFMAFIHIILFSMLIALMRDIFIKVQETEGEEFLRGRAQLIVELETTMRRTQLEYYSLMPPYVHMLTSVQRVLAAKDTNIESRMERLEDLLIAAAQGQAFTARPGFSGSRQRTLVGQNSTLAGLEQGDGTGGVRAPPGLPGGPNDAAYRPSMDGDMMVSEAEQLAHMQAQLSQVANQLHLMSEENPNLVKQFDKLQRSVAEQDTRMTGMLAALRDIEALIRNQGPVVVETTSMAGSRKSKSTLTEAELENEVKRLLGKQSVEPPQ